MSQIVIYLPGNLAAHAEVLARKRRTYVENFESARRVLANAPVPVVSNFHGVDFDFSGTSPEKKQGSCHYLNTSYGHLLPSLLERSAKEHVQWQYRNGARVTTLGLFNSEFDLFRGNDIAVQSPDGEPEIMFGLATGDTFMYSECGTYEVKSEGKFTETGPLRFHDKIIVPLYGVADAQKAFFLWQRLPSKENADALAMELRKIATNGRGDIMTFFIDLEAPLVGSDRDLPEIWGMFFDLIVASGIKDSVVSLPEAVRYWRRVAGKLPETPRYFVRQLGTKWTGLHVQTDWLQEMADAGYPEDIGDDATQVAWSFVTTSDVFAVKNRQYRGNVLLKSEKGEVCITVNPDVVTVAKTILQAFEKRTRPEDALKKLDLPDPDSRWYADRVADVIASYRK